MTRDFRFTSLLMLGLIATLVVASQTAQAQVTKPFKVNGSGFAPSGLPLPGQPPRPHYIEGNATHLGRHSGGGAVQTLTADLSNPFLISGTFESNPGFNFVGANGDVLACTYGDPEGGASTQGTYTLTAVGNPGFGELYIARFIAEFVPTAASTGKFAGVSGGWVMYATSKPFRLGSTDRFYYSWYGDGKLTFKQGR